MNNNYLKIFFGIIIVLYLIYNRLFRLRNPRELYANIDLIKSVLFFIIFSAMVFALLYNIKQWYNSKYGSKNTTKSRYFYFFQQVYQHPKNPLHFWTNSLTSLDGFFKNKMPAYDTHKTYAHHITENLCKVFIRYKNFSLACLLLLKIIPQLIICSTFFVDVVINQKFYYFYKTLWVLIISMLISYIVYSIKLDTDTNFILLNKILTLKVISKSNININHTFTLDAPNNYDNAIPVSLEEWYFIAQKDPEESYVCYTKLQDDFLKGTEEIKQAIILKYCVDSMYMFFTFRSYLDTYEKYKLMVETPFNILKYTLYSIAWAYIIYYGLYLN